MSGIRETPAPNAMEFVLSMALCQQPQTFANLWPLANRISGFAPMDADAPGYRFTDRWLQKGRRKGTLTYNRFGRQTVWSLTAEARDQFVRTLADATNNPNPPS